MKIELPLPKELQIDSVDVSLCLDNLVFSKCSTCDYEQASVNGIKTSTGCFVSTTLAQIPLIKS